MLSLPNPLRLAFVCTFLCVGASPLIAQHPRVETIDVSSGTRSGQKERGPVTIVVTNINPIRYQYSFNDTTTFSTPVDLFSNLTSLTTQPAPAPATRAPAAHATVPQLPGAPATPESPEIAPPGAPSGSAATKKTAAKSPNTAWEAIQTLLTQAISLCTTFKKTHDDFSTQTQPFSGPLSKFSDESTALRAAQTQANNSTGLVNQATSTLHLYLTSDYGSKPAFESNLMSETNAQLTAGSTFMVGVGASWPTTIDGEGVTDFQNELAVTIKTLNDVSATLPAYAATELPTLQGLQQSMGALLSQIQTGVANYKKIYTLTPDQTNYVNSAQTSLTANINLANQDIAYLNKLPADLNTAIQQGATAVTNAAALAPSSTAYSNFAAAHDALAWWKNRMSDVQARFNAHGDAKDPDNPFVISDSEDCHFTFSMTKDTTVTLNQIDLSQPVASQKAAAVLSLTVECTSPFSLSAGVAFSTIPDAQYAITPDPASTTTTPVNDITQTSTSRFHPLPLGLISYRFFEYRNEKVAYYASFGVATNIRSQSNGGSAAEYLIGPSIGFARTFIITLGAHLGSQPSVTPPYYVGYKGVPSTVTAVPVSTSYTAGFGLGITFTKP